MKNFIKFFFTLLVSTALCNTYIGCVSMNVTTTQTIDIDENPDAEFVINAIWLKEPIEAKFVLEKSTGRNETYKIEKTETLQLFKINPKDKIRVRFNAEKLNHKLFIGESDFNCVGLRFSSGNWGNICYVDMKGKSRVITLTKNGKRLSADVKKYKL